MFRLTLRSPLQKQLKRLNNASESEQRSSFEIGRSKMQMKMDMLIILADNGGCLVACH